MDVIFDWITGQLSSAARVWTAVGPAVLLVAYLLLGLAAYAIRVAVRGPYLDPEIEQRGHSVLVGMWPRRYFAWVMQPFWWGLRRTGIPPDALTTLSVLLSVGSGVSLAAGRFALGGWLYIFAGICDFFDGRLARATGRSGPQGAALDSVLDRYADSAVLVGLAWFYRDSWVLLAVLLALVGSLMVSYVRARGEGLGVQIREGLMQRPERIVYLGFCVAFSPVMEAISEPDDPRPLHRLAVIGIVLLAGSTQLTAMRRLFVLLRRLGGKPLKGFKSLDRNSLLRSSVSSAVATGTDFTVVLFLVSTGLGPVAATALGALVGGAVNFAINRVWAFNAHLPAVGQASRYTFVSATSAGLNAGGVAVLLLLPGLDYRIAWWIVRGLVYVAWNFPLHRDYVFPPARDPQHGMA